MKTVLAGLLFIAAGSAAFAGLDANMPPGNRVILTNGTWIPNLAQTEQALRAVQEFLNHPPGAVDQEEIKKILANGSEYRVQFSGIHRDGRKLIRCNFFPGPRRGNSKDSFTYWREEEVMVDDGGFWFWQIEYDVEAGRCQKFLSNGYA